MTDPEKATIGDLFRLMTEMRSENSTKFGAINTKLEAHGAKLDAHSEELSAIRKTQEDQTAKLDDAAKERQAIRDVVDNDLAGQGQVIQLDGKLTEVQKTMRQITRELRGTTSRLDRAGIPA